VSVGKHVRWTLDGNRKEALRNRQPQTWPYGRFLTPALVSHMALLSKWQFMIGVGSVRQQSLEALMLSSRFCVGRGVLAHA